MHNWVRSCMNTNRLHNQKYNQFQGCCCFYYSRLNLNNHVLMCMSEEIYQQQCDCSIFTPEIRPIVGGAAPGSIHPSII